jgi:hypothetical protein
LSDWATLSVIISKGRVVARIQYQKTKVELCIIFSAQASLKRYKE